MDTWDQECSPKVMVAFNTHKSPNNWAAKMAQLESPIAPLTLAASLLATEASPMAGEMEALHGLPPWVPTHRGWPCHGCYISYMPATEANTECLL